MPKSRPPYPPAFRRQMVELVRTGRTPEELAREFEPTAQAIRNWVAQADRDGGPRSDVHAVMVKFVEHHRQRCSELHGL